MRSFLKPAFPILVLFLIQVIAPTFAQATSCPECGEAGNIITDLSFKSQYGPGEWPSNSFAPFTADKPCGEADQNRGFRYNKYTHTYKRTGYASGGSLIDGTFTSTALPSGLYENENYGKLALAYDFIQRPYTSPYSYYVNPGSGSNKTNIKIVTGNTAETYQLSKPVGMRILTPVDIIPPAKEAYRDANDLVQTCEVTGQFASCPGKYEVTLYYDEYPLVPPPPPLIARPVPQSLPPEIVEIKDTDLPKGKQVKYELPTAQCTRAVFNRIEYRPLDESGSGVGGGEGDGSIFSQTSLGRLPDGQPAGRLYLHAQTVTPEIFSPLSQSYQVSTPADTQVIRDSVGALRQIRSPDALVDITPLQTGLVDSGYEIAIYHPEDFEAFVDVATGLYLPIGSPLPFLTIAYENPDAPAVSNALATRIQIKRTSLGASPKVTTFENLGSGATAYKQGNGLLRIVKTTTHSGADTTIQTDSYSPASASSPSAVKWTITRSFPFGDRLIEQSRGTDPNRIFTLFNYDEALGSPTYGLLIGRIGSDGSWERYAYDNEKNLTTILSPLGDAPPEEIAPAYLRRTEFSTTSVPDSLYGEGKLTTTVEYSGTTEISRRHRFIRAELQPITFGASNWVTEHTIDVIAASPGSDHDWDAPINSFSHTYRVAGGTQAGVSVLKIDTGGQVEFTLPSVNPIGSTCSTKHWIGTPNTLHSSTATPTDIVAGIRSTTITTLAGLPLSEETRDATTGLLLTSLTYDDHDSKGRPRLVTSLDGSEESREYSPCCGQLTSVTHRGLNTTYDYDELGRPKWEKVEASSGAGLQTLSYVRFTYDSEGRVLTRVRVPTSGAEQLIERNAYDNAGTLLSTATPGSVAIDPALTRVTSYTSTYDSATGRTTRTTTLPGGATEITVTDRDGRIFSRTGTAVAPVRYEYGTAVLSDADQWGLDPATPLPFTREIKLNAALAGTTELITTYSDFLGRTIKTVFGDGAAARNFYDLAGRLVRQVDPDGVQALHSYTPAAANIGEVQLTAVNLSDVIAGVPMIDLDGSDRITRQTRLVGTRVDGSVTYTVQRSTTEVWEADGDPTPTVVSITETTPDGLRSWQTRYPDPANPTTTGFLTATVTTYDDATATRTDTTTYPDDTQTIRVSIAGRPVRDTRTDSTVAAIAETTYGYDDHGRLNVTCSLQAPASPVPAPGSPLATTTTYYADDQPATVTTPDPDATRNGQGYDPQTTSYAYDAAGRVETVTQPDATQAFTTYWPTGAVKRTWGSRTYPSEYAYDAQGRVKTLTTWQAFASSAGAAVTTWNYSLTRGWLVSKRYTDDTGPDYDYKPSGRLKTRDWARTLPGSVPATRLRTSYEYNDAGDLWTIDYADSTPDVTNTYDRLGRLKTTTDAAGLLTRTYQNGLLDDETYASGSAILSGLVVTRTQDVDDEGLPAPRLNRSRTLAATGLATLTYGYDSAGRLGTLSQATRIATLGYKHLVGTHQSTAITVSGTVRYATIRNTDALGRIARVETGSGSLPLAPGSILSSRDYTYNAANQRSEVVNEDALRWAYGYDALDQVTSAQKKSATLALIPGYDHAYSYDTIGNRINTITNGRFAPYVTDLTNQYVSRVVPPGLDVLGAAPAYDPVTNPLSPTGANVLVAGELPARDGELFYRAVPVANASAPVFQSVTIHAARPATPAQTAADPSAKDLVATETRTAFVAETPESYAYDLDGNLTQDGRWTYTWDAENRLIALETRTDVAAAAPTLPRQKLLFAYDAQSRRIRKEVQLWNGTTYVSANETRFLYDGWNLLAEYSGSTGATVLRTHVWGPDLSGSAQGAGGVGGLLWTTSGSASYSPGWDANGNIIAWIDLATGAVSGRRDYGAFGEPLLSTGIANSLPFAFSTKYRDSETELYYYGFRYYTPSTARWLSRDPIGERGGMNLYGMIGNNVVNRWDYLGLKGCCCIESMTINPPAPVADFSPFKPDSFWGVGSVSGRYKLPYTFIASLKHYKNLPDSPCKFAWTETFSRVTTGSGSYSNSTDFVNSLNRQAAEGDSTAEVTDTPGFDLGLKNHGTSNAFDLKIVIQGDSPGSCCKLKSWTMTINIHMEYDGATQAPVLGAQKFRATVVARP